MTSLFDYIDYEDRNDQRANRRAIVLANHRVDDRLGKFVKAASTADERKARLSLVQDDLESIVAGACQEVGFGDPAKILSAINERLAEVEPTTKTAAVHESRRPKMCPYHSEVVDASLAAGDPGAGYNAMAQHAWGEAHCQGGWEGRCNFKPQMTTQSYWDERKELAEQRREEREEQRRLEQEQAEQAVEQTETPAEPISEAPEGEGAEVLETPSEGLTEAPGATPEAEVPMAMAASAADRAPLDGSQSRTAELQKLAPGNEHLPYATPKRNRQYEHIKESCLERGGSEDECKELAARTVNKQRAEHGETKSHSVHASIKQGYGNPGDGYNDILDEEGDYDDDNAICPTCGGPGMFLGGLGRLNHYRCRNCGMDFNEPAHPHEPSEPGYHGYASVREAAELQGEHLGPIKREKVTQGETNGPVPKMDKRKWTPETVNELDYDDPNGPHPSKRKDVVERIHTEDTGARHEIGESVLEHQDVTQEGGPSKTEQGGTWGGGESAVTSAKLEEDVDRNPIQALIEGDYDGFPPEAEVQQAISRYRG